MAQIPIREAAMLALLAVLQAALPAVPIERSRRSDIGEGEALPRLVVTEGAHDADESDANGEVLYRLAVTIAGYCSADSDAALASAINAQHAAIIAALVGVPLDLGGGLDAWVTEARFEPDLATLANAAEASGGFYLDLTLDLRAPAGAPYVST